MRYEYRHGMSSKAVSAEAAYTELERIRAEHDDRLSPRDVVDESRPEVAVLHPFFEWDDGAAAEAYRVDQARKLTRSVYVVASDQQGRDLPSVPVYFHVERHNYQPASVVVNQPDLFEQALQELQRQLAAAERAVRELEAVSKTGKDPDRMAAIGLAVQGFEAVRAAVAIIR